MAQKSLGIALKQVRVGTRSFWREHARRHKQRVSTPDPAGLPRTTETVLLHPQAGYGRADRPLLRQALQQTQLIVKPHHIHPHFLSTYRPVNLKSVVDILGEVTP